MRTKSGYRIWQFWQSLGKPPCDLAWHKVEGLLTPRELALFRQLPVPDQNHSLRVLNTLERGGESDPDLLKAALLHDIGKILHPLRRWERVYAVLLGNLFPETAARWGKMEPRGLRRAPVIIQQHPVWGAGLAEEAGCSSRVVDLIRYHEREELTGLLDQAGVELMEKLQRADNSN